MKRTRSRLAGRVESMNLQLFWVTGQSNSDKTRFDGLAQCASDRARKISLCFTLQRNLLGDHVLIGAIPLAGIDHVSARDRSISLDHAGQTLFELRHLNPPQACRHFLRPSCGLHMRELNDAI